MPERGHFAHQSHPGRIDVAQEPIAERDVPFEEFFDLGDVGVALEFLDELQDDAEAGGGAFLDHFGLESARDLPGLRELRAAGLLDNRPLPGAALPEDDEEAPTGQSELFED